MISLTYKCQYCEKETPSQLDLTGPMPTGTLLLCDCPQSRSAWEAEHRKQMELRKNAQRGSAVRSRSIVHVGRTPLPVGKRRSR